MAGSVEHGFDDNFRMTSQKVNNANQIDFGYDNDDLLTAAGDLDLSRDAQNGLITATEIADSSNEVSDTMSYTPSPPLRRASNGFGEIEHYEAKYNTSEYLDLGYTRDSLGCIMSVTEQLTLPGQSTVTTTKHYKYDTAGRLYRVCAEDNCTTILSQYQFDDNSNVITDGTHSSFSATQGSIDGTYDEQDRLTQATHGLVTTDYTYTDNGELLTKTVGSDVTEYEYDVLGNLRHVDLPNTTDDIDYVIDGQNRRIGKKVDGTLVQGFLYQDQLEPVAELDGSGAIVSRFIYGTRAHVPDYMIKGGVKYRIISDHLGSVRLVVKISDGSIAQHIAYDEYGVITADTAPGFQPFAYGGGIYDQDTGLTRFGARDYDPSIGRWTAKDPIGFGGRDSNLYAYVRSDPMNRLDPDGRFSITTGLTIGLASVVASISGVSAYRATLHTWKSRCEKQLDALDLSATFINSYVSTAQEEIEDQVVEYAIQGAFVTFFASVPKSAAIAGAASLRVASATQSAAWLFGSTLGTGLAAAKISFLELYSTGLCD